LQVLQEIRDEAHRFALSRHRRRRSARSLRSRIDDIPGVGPRRKKALLQRFGSARGLSAASLPELQELLGSLMGQRVFDEVRKWPADDQPQS
jgi:excinuclease ABC subunit C